MQNFTQLFTETLNSTVAALVAAAVAEQAETIQELVDRCAYLDQRVHDLEMATPDTLDVSSIENRLDDLEMADIDSVVEKAIDDYDFADVVSRGLDWESIGEDRDFSRAVRAAISDALA